MLAYYFIVNRDVNRYAHDAYPLIPAEKTVVQYPGEEEKEFFFLSFSFIFFPAFEEKKKAKKLTFIFFKKKKKSKQAGRGTSARPRACSGCSRAASGAACPRGPRRSRRWFRKEKDLFLLCP